MSSTRFSDVDAHAWDDFAEQCGGSLRSAYAHLRAFRLKAVLGRRLQLYELHQGEGVRRRKIAQCAIVHTPGRKVFYDGLLLLPEHADLWAPAMAQMLCHLGGGDYDYGWAWSLETPREEQLAAIEGVDVRDVRSFHVHGVDFSQWSDWESYYRDVRENCRRQARKAEERNPGMKLVFQPGLAAVLGLPGLTTTLRAMCARKGIRFKPTWVLAAMFNILTSPGTLFVASVTHGRRVLATFQGVEFGSKTYYLNGGSASEANGAAWYMLLWLAERAFERHPKGKFMIGYADSPPIDPIAAKGLLHSRRGLRVSEWSTSRVGFHWTPPRH